MDSIAIIAIIIAQISCFADAATTYLCLTRFKGSETNFIMKAFFNVFGLKIGVLVPNIIVLLFSFHLYINYSFTYFILVHIIIIVLKFVVSISNYRILNNKNGFIPDIYKYLNVFKLIKK